jgi:hypothetical protein
LIRVWLEVSNPVNNAGLKQPGAVLKRWLCIMINRHERRIAVAIEQVSPLLDRLASADDALWPHNRQWPPMRFDRGLQVGATGGHGRIRYSIEAYTPGHEVVFRFLGPAGLEGTHRFSLLAEGEHTRLVHLIEAELGGSLRWQWPLLFRPMHDALIEDAFDNAEAYFQPGFQRGAWSLYVRVLRGMFGWLHRLSGSGR